MFKIYVTAEYAGEVKTHKLTSSFNIFKCVSIEFNSKNHLIRVLNKYTLLKFSDEDFIPRLCYILTRIKFKV